MDPNEAFRRYLEAHKRATELYAVLDVIEAQSEALEAADDLFEWLSNGGFQPDWARVAKEVLG